MIIKIKAQPKSSKSTLEKISDNKYKAYLKSAPVDNKANEELIKLLAKEFGVKRYNIEIIKGLTNRSKLVKIDK